MSVAAAEMTSLKIPLREEPEKISSIILKLAAHCNLNCSYCYVYNREDQSYRERPKFMNADVLDCTLEAIKAYCDAHAPWRMSIVFHGGEPTLVGAKRFDHIATRAAEVLSDRLRYLSIQTNALLINEAWTEVLARHDVAVSVSLDGTPDAHDAVRLDRAGRGSYARTVAGLRRLQDSGLDPTVLCVVTPGSSGRDVYRHFRSLDIERMDFLLPDVSHDHKERYYGGCGPTPVADFLIPALDAWLDEDNPAVKIRVFGDLFTLLMGGNASSDAFGNPRMSYLIVETDGAIEALDALRVCEEGIAVSGLNVRQHGFDDLARGLPLVHQAVQRGFPLPAACRSCSERDVCGGGFLPHRYSRAKAFDNPSVWCADILKLTAHMRGHLERCGFA